jgi:hypothetical protein
MNQIQTNEVTQLNNNEFDFILNSIWTTIVTCLDSNLSSIFSPADPDIFHQNYLTSFQFLGNFEAKCMQLNEKENINFKVRFHNSHSYKYFVKKWPTQVYYQIRFQEIVTKIEEDLCEHDQTLSHSNDPNENVEDNELNDTDQNHFHLRISDTIVKQIEYIWCESNCFLKCLLSQFWKLNLQIISRYCSFFMQLFQIKLSFLEKNDQQIQLNNNNNNINKLQESTDSMTIRSKTPTNESNRNELATSQSSIDDLSLCVLLLLDVNKLSSIKLPNFFDAIIAPNMRSANAVKDISLLKDAFFCSLNSLNELQMVLCDFIIRNLTNECAEHLKNVNDIARLYRRTNREV